MAGQDLVNLCVRYLQLTSDLAASEAVLQVQDKSFAIRKRFNAVVELDLDECFALEVGAVINVVRILLVVTLLAQGLHVHDASTQVHTN